MGNAAPRVFPAWSAAMAGEEEVFRGILDALPVAICLVHAPSWHVGFANAAMERLLGGAIAVGRAYDELTALFDQITPGGAPAQFEDRALYRTLVRGETVHGVEVFVDVEEGRIPLLMSTTPIRDDASGMTIAGVVCLEDLRPLRDVDRAKDEFLALVSHELRSPLTVILGHATALLMPDVAWAPNQQRQSLEELRRQAERLAAMVGGLLDLSAISAGRFRISREWTDLPRLIRTAVHAHPARLGGREVRLDLPRRFPRVFLDPARLEQVLGNLLDNVARHTPPGTAVTIRLARLAEGGIVLSVEDTGPGIPMEVREGLFRRFASGPRSGGAGLGLAIARGIVHEHGGTIEARERPGGGTVMEIRLPSGEGEPSGDPP